LNTRRSGKNKEGTRDLNCHNLGFPYVTQRNDSIPFNELNITYYKKGSNHMWKKSIIDVIHVHQYIKEKNDPNDTELRESLH